ncbi:hypothetical protein ABPG74_010330 [Tetrahymena malaccensis]
MRADQFNLSKVIDLMCLWFLSFLRLVNQLVCKKNKLLMSQIQNRFGESSINQSINQQFIVIIQFLSQLGNQQKVQQLFENCFISKQKYKSTNQPLLKNLNSCSGCKIYPFLNHFLQRQIKDGAIQVAQGALASNQTLITSKSSLILCKLEVW